MKFLIIILMFLATSCSSSTKKIEDCSLDNSCEASLKTQADKTIEALNNELSDSVAAVPECEPHLFEEALEGEERGEYQCSHEPLEDSQDEATADDEDHEDAEDGSSQEVATPAE